MPSFRFLPRRALATLAGVVIAASLAFQPLAAGASQPDTDIILGEPESERQDAANDRPNIEARNAIVMSADGTVYFERDADAQVKIASITKVMTAILAIENASLDDMVTVDHAAATVGQSSANLKEGDTLTMEAALRALLIPSGNDAAMAIATTVGAKIDPASTDPWGTFVQAMNDKAAEIGMASTKFTNPHGLDFDGWEGDMHSSARDVATMLAYAMKNETFRQIDSSDNNVITVTGADGEQRDITMRRYNTILGQGGNIGGKTGSTYEALNCFAGVFSREPGGEIYSIVLGCEEEEQRLAESMALADWYYNHTVDYPVVNTEQTTPDGEPLIARAPHADWTDKSVDVTTTDTGSTVVLFSLAGEVEQDVELQTITGDVTEGQSVGTLTLSQDGKELASVELVSAENVEAPDPLSWILVQLDRVVRFVTGQPGTAELEVIADAPDALEVDAA
ncbi:serine hydrolase [Collinsella tanakaei]|uniref:D-alanyl-D-alanine carboxypeptidase family protein n=1 Tax=Collinsella tanakaei TaxID=626935 RepID=UPI0025A3ACB3|nr:serine hydrolase [Collinsella tanakaei]MDM8246457.1 serine hydrolase [Collinsella tanakaei]